MKIDIICSKKDEASKNIHEHLLLVLKSHSENQVGEHKVKLHLMEKESIYMENIDKELGCDMIIFATKHVSKSGIHSLSVHTQGNWGSADYGGVKRDLGISPACWLKEGLRLLEKKSADLHYEAIQECTHHGPQLSTPSFFIEIGSSLKEWQNKNTGKIIANTIMELLEMKIPSYKTAVGIGGLHHTPSFKKIVLNTNIAIGHVCPKYNLHALDEKMLMQALEKTEPKANLVLVDWKGLGEHKEKVLELLKKVSVEWKKTKEII